MRGWYSKVRDTELIDGNVMAIYEVVFETDDVELKREVEKYLQGIMDRAEQTEPTTEDCSMVESIVGNIDTENAKYSYGNEQTEPQTERIKTLDYCDICNHKGCDNCIANNLDDYCVPSGYEPTTQTETQNSNLTFEKDECAKEYEELGLRKLKELRKDEPQADCPWK